jgi:hypothetical protein
MSGRTCPSCGWPASAGHDRDCKLLTEGGDERRYPAGSEQLPELCVIELREDGREPAAFVSVPRGADLANHVAIPLVAYLGLWRQAFATGNPGPIEERLQALEQRVAEATEVAARATAALERFVRAVEAERNPCAECDGNGTVDAPAGTPAEGGLVSCESCRGTGRAR